jgi:hypothetical protein
LPNPPWRGTLVGIVLRITTMSEGSHGIVAAVRQALARCAAACLVLLFVLDGAPAWGVASDYAEGFLVAPEHDHPAARMILPARFYEVAVSADYADLEVFDAAGNAVPFALTAGDDAAGSYSDWHDLPVFASPEPLLTDVVGSTSLAVQLAADGTVGGIMRRSVAGGSVPIRLAAGAVLVDVTDYPGRLDDLRIDWMDTFDDFTVALTIEGSEDLVTWTPITDQAVIASLHADGLHIRQQQVGLPPASARYLRITPQDADGVARIRRVQGRARPARARHRAYKQLEGQLASSMRGIEFDTGGRFPVDRVSIDLPRPNHALDARLFSRARHYHEWRLRGQHVFYRIDHAAISARAAPLAIERTPDRFWQIEASGNGDVDPSLLPKLEISWLPHELTWVRTGAAPYTVAFGRAGAEVKARALLLERLQELLEPGADVTAIPLSSPQELLLLGGAGAVVEPGVRSSWPLVAVIAAAALGFFAVLALLLRRRQV